MSILEHSRFICQILFWLSFVLFCLSFGIDRDEGGLIFMWICEAGIWIFGPFSTIYFFFKDSKKNKEKPKIEF